MSERRRAPRGAITTRLAGATLAGATLAVATSAGATLAAVMLAAVTLASGAAAQSGKSLVGIHELAYELVHPTVLPKLKERSRQLEGVDLALDPALPFRVKLTPGKRPREFVIDAEPKVGVTRLIVPGLINAKVVHRGREKAVRFELWDHSDGLWIVNHCGGVGTVGGHELIFVDFDHDGLVGELTDGYVVKLPKQKSWTDADGRVQFRAMTDPLVVDGKQHWLQVDSAGYTLVVSTQMPDLTAKRDESYEQALTLLNGWRKRLGHAPVTLRVDLSRACEEHALYCACNAVLEHVQDPKLPGASTKGARVAAVAELAYATTMEAGLQLWLNTFFHRISMLRPGLQRVGMGHMHGVAVLDAKTDAAKQPAEPFVWPPDGATEVPCQWQSGEDPSPLGDVEWTPVLAANWGYPVTVTFPSAMVTQVVATLRIGGAELPVFVSSPEAPSNRTFPDNLASILVMARTPLPFGTEVTVDVTCQHAGKPWAKTWTFRTRGR